MVGLKDENNPSGQALQFTEVLKGAGLHPVHAKWAVPIGKLDFDLFICPEH
jgi:hypothetical protein